MKRPYLRIFCHDKFKVTWIINATSHCKFPARLCIDGRKGVDLTNLQDYISALASIIEECPQTPILIHKGYLVHKDPDAALLVCCCWRLACTGTPLLCSHSVEVAFSTTIFGCHRVIHILISHYLGIPIVYETYKQYLLPE